MLSIQSLQAPVVDFANLFLKFGVNSKDAIHVAAAILGEADYFLTTDDRLLKKMAGTKDIKAINPVDLVEVIDEHNN
jgi:predicted nucleic acid-binding protein